MNGLQLQATRAMRFNQTTNLRIIHRLKDAGGRGMPSAIMTALSTHGLLIDTCLRQLWIAAMPNQPDSSLIDLQSDYLEDRDAYNLLLQTITGLNSSVPGETNVTGQFKCAWKRWKNSAPLAQIRPVDNLMQHLLRDCSEIRNRHLSGTGGYSYGSLVRKLLRPAPDRKILFVGAGKFSRSLLPFFSKQRTALWNHRLHSGLTTDNSIRLFAAAEPATAAAWADDLVLTTPADQPLNEALWQQLTTKHQIATVVHLGRRRTDPGPWQQHAGTFFNLDDVFSLRSKLADERDLRIANARRACAEIAYETASRQTYSGSPLLRGA